MTDTITIEEASGLAGLLAQSAKVWGPDNHWAMLSQYGHEGKTLPFTPDEQKALRELKRGLRCIVGQCVMNAQKLAIRGNADPNVKYIEGLVTTSGVPIDHAWIEYNGKVFDPTLADEKWKMKSYKKPLTGKRERGEYFGVEVPKCLIIPHQLKSKMYTFLSHRWLGVEEDLQKKIWVQQ